MAPRRLIVGASLDVGGAARGGRYRAVGEARSEEEAFVDARIERRGLLDVEKLAGAAEKPFPTVADATTDASDHGAVWAEFEL